MLLDSPRLTPADRAAWTRWARLDAALAAADRARLDRLADRARAVIEAFADGGPCHAGTSWGKDSTVVADLLATSGAADRVPLIWARAERAEMPECEAVRDALLARHPHLRYEERVYRWQVPLRPAPGWDDPSSYRDHLGTVLDGRYISGVRAAESGKRTRTMRANGVASAATCRPIGWWSDTDLWAYLALHDLPVHPAYAMTYGGELDRSRLRVHPVGTRAGAGFKVAWEDAYYPDVLAGNLAARPGAPTPPRPPAP